MISSIAINIFSKVIEHYHIIDDINQKYDNPYKKKTIESLLHKKVCIETIQWHLEDIIRDPNIDVKYALKIKREIDLSNQNRTDVVEQVDDYFLNLYSDVKIKKNAVSLNSYVNIYNLNSTRSTFGILKFRKIIKENLKKNYKKIIIFSNQNFANILSFVSIIGLGNKVKIIGYEQDGFHWEKMNVDCFLHQQSPDIA